MFTKWPLYAYKSLTEAPRAHKGLQQVTVQQFETLKAELSG
jgi:hypothetical protein